MGTNIDIAPDNKSIKKTVELLTEQNGILQNQIRKSEKESRRAIYIAVSALFFSALSLVPDWSNWLNKTETRNSLRIEERLIQMDEKINRNLLLINDSQKKQLKNLDGREDIDKTTKLLMDIRNELIEKGRIKNQGNMFN